MMQFGPATARVVSFGNAATRVEQDIRREKAQTEKVAEGLIRQLEREAAAIGKTKDEMREAKIEALALAAAQQGNADIADRLLAASRQRRLAADAAAEDQSIAAAQAARAAAQVRTAAEAAINAQLLERSRLEAALEKNFGVGRPSAIASGATFSALAERERALELSEKQAVAERELIAIERQQNNVLAERANIQAALERTTGVGRSSAIDNGATFSALAARAADDEARAMNAAAVSAERLAREHAELVAMVRGSQAAMEADAVAAERLRLSTDPLYAAVSRLNAEIAESTRLYHNGATAPGEYARQQEVLAARLRATGEQHELMAVAGGKNATAMRNLAIQMPDVVQGLLTGQKPFTILIQQGGQLVQVAMMVEGGLKAMAAAAATLALYLSPLIVIAGVAYGAFKLFQSQVKDGGELTRYRDNLGLTHKEMLQLGEGVDKAGDKISHLTDVTITAGDVMAGLWKTIKDTAKPPAGDWSSFSNSAVDAFRKVLDAWNVVSAGITAGIYGTVNAAKVIWQNFATSVGDVFYQAVNIAITAMNKLVKTGTDLLNGFIHVANKIPGIAIGDVAAPQKAEVANPYAGASSRDSAAAAAKVVGDGYRKAYGDARKEDDAFWKQVGANAKQSAKDRMDEEAAAIKANRTPKKTPVDRNALNAEAIEAQIRNLYKLADAYDTSGAAALIAEARVKAESAAIKSRADVEEAVARQIRLAIAQRVTDAAKSTAAMQQQATIQEQVNREIAAGNVPASLAAEIVRDRIADLPLLAALQAAQQIGDQKGIEAATAALDNQRAARERLTAAERKPALELSLQAGRDSLAQQQLELSLIGATDEARARALATLRATQEATAKGWSGEDAAAYIQLMGDVAAQGVINTVAQDAYNHSLTETADRWDIIASKVQSAASGMADAFGSVGKAIGDVASIYSSYQAQRSRAEVEHNAQVTKANGNQVRLAQENRRFALQSAGAQIAAYGDMAGAAKGFFKEGSAGYQALAAAEKVYRIAQFAMSLQAMAQQVAETLGFVTSKAAQATASGTAGIAEQAKLTFPYNIIAMAATGAALVAAGIAVFGGSSSGGSKGPTSNTGIGTVLGDPAAKSDSIKNAIDALHQVDTLMLSSSRQMAASLKSIDSQIGGVAAVLVRSGDVGGGTVQASQPSGILGSLFGTRIDVNASGLFAGAQSLQNVLASGLNTQAYSDITKVSKFLGIVTSKKTSTTYGAADPSVGAQFTLILRSFNDAIKAAAGPLGESTQEIQNRLNSFVIDLGKIDLKGLTGEEIQSKLSAVFGAAADQMAATAFPGIQQFQRVGEGLFETLVRVSSTTEAVTAALDQMAGAAPQLSVAAKLGLTDQFDSISDFTSAVGAYFDGFFSSEEQAAAKTAQFSKVFDSLGLSMPNSLSGFRALVEAQDLTTAAGQATYATLLKLAPAFADLQASLSGAKSAADIASERADLQRQLLELRGDTAAIRADDLAKLDPSNRALQQQIWAMQDAQDAAKAAQTLADAWKSVGDSIMTEILRIRGLSTTGTDSSFASLMGQFNAATTSARGGDQDAAKLLPGLSQSLLTAAAAAATSKQELDRIRAQTAASLEATYGVISALAKAPTSATDPTNAAAIAAAPATSTAAAAANDAMASELSALREEVAGMRRDNNAGHAATSGNTGAIKRKLDDVTAPSGGQAVSVAYAA